MKHIFVGVGFLCFLQRQRHAEPTKSEPERSRKDIHLVLEPYETRHMMCHSNPPVGFTNIPAFLPLVSLLVIPSVACFLPGAVQSGPVFYSLAFLARALPGIFMLCFQSLVLHLSMVGYFFFLICFLLFSSLFIYPLTYSQITLSCSLFYLPRLPSSLNSLSCCLYNYSFFHPSPLLCASYFISGSFFCLLSLVSCHLCRMT